MRRGRRRTKWIWMQCMLQVGLCSRTKAIGMSYSSCNRIKLKPGRVRLEPTEIWIMELKMVLVEEERPNWARSPVVCKRTLMGQDMRPSSRRDRTCHRVEHRTLNQLNQQLMAREITWANFRRMPSIIKVRILNNPGQNKEASLVVQSTSITYRITTWATPAWILIRMKTFSALFSL